MWMHIQHKQCVYSTMQTFALCHTDWFPHISSDSFLAVDSRLSVLLCFDFNATLMYPDNVMYLRALISECKNGLCPSSYYALELLSCWKACKIYLNRVHVFIHVTATQLDCDSVSVPCKSFHVIILNARQLLTVLNPIIATILFTIGRVGQKVLIQLWMRPCVFMKNKQQPEKAEVAREEGNQGRSIKSRNLQNDGGTKERGQRHLCPVSERAKIQEWSFLSHAVHFQSPVSQSCNTSELRCIQYKPD